MIHREPWRRVCRPTETDTRRGRSVLPRPFALSIIHCVLDQQRFPYTSSASLPAALIKDAPYRGCLRGTPRRNVVLASALENPLFAAPVSRPTRAPRVRPGRSPGRPLDHLLHGAWNGDASVMALVGRQQPAVDQHLNLGLEDLQTNEGQAVPATTAPVKRTWGVLQSRRSMDEFAASPGRAACVGEFTMSHCKSKAVVTHRLGRTLLRVIRDLLFELLKN